MGSPMQQMEDELKKESSEALVEGRLVGGIPAGVYGNRREVMLDDPYDNLDTVPSNIHREIQARLEWGLMSSVPPHAVITPDVETRVPEPSDRPPLTLDDLDAIYRTMSPDGRHDVFQDHDHEFTCDHCNARHRFRITLRNGRIHGVREL